jgi:DNA polymerase V
VFISTSRFRQNPDEVYTAASWQLPFPTSYTPGIINAAQSLLERIYKPGFVYHKAGIFLSDIVPDTERQQSILTGIDDERRVRVMRAVDEINRRHGRYTVRPLAVSSERGWEMKRQHVSPRYTTRLDEVLRVKACRLGLILRGRMPCNGQQLVHGSNHHGRHGNEGTAD